MQLRPLLFLLLLGLLIGCGARERTQQVYDEWGRASLQGETTRAGEIAVAARADGSMVMLAAFGRNLQATETLEIQIIDNNNQVMANFPIALQGESPRDLQLIAQDDMATAAWIEQIDSWRVLRIVTFGWDGVVEDERLVSAENSDIRWYRLQYANADSFYLFWLDDSDTLFGEFWQSGERDSIFAQSNVNSADFDEAVDGTLHIVWMSDEDHLTYTQLPPNRLRPRSARGIPITTDQIHLTLDQTDAYVSWIDDSSSQIFYTTFAIPTIVPTDLISSDATALPIQSDYPPTRMAAQSTTYPYTQLADANLASALVDTNSRIVTRQGQHAEAIFATTLQLQTRSRQYSQPVVAYFQAGALIGYQALTWTGANSGGVAISADRQDNLYLGWSDVQRGDKPVYLITTHPELRAATDSLTMRDYWLIGVGGIGRILQAFRLIPLVLPWLLAPVFYFFFVVALVSGDTVQTRAQNAFLLGVVIYEAVKMWFGLRGDVPLVRYIPNMGLLDPAVYQLLIYIVPLVILTISSLIVWFVYMRRARQVVHSTWFILLILLDYTLSLAFYALQYYA